MREKGARHLPSGIAAALGVGPAPQKYYRVDHATQSSHRSGELLQKTAA
ncbi:BZ3500_MvSof-1268-A1-R1_Chr12-2g03813 [Microbotryum saponariae]|uniref:BZ3500_MvSof-1268-A1-R1_Chr12-2g03813 protein n=1 Tax=Microbotryum saponariae TaxID=289078 RepID=A0A2X0MJA1_9BASI|nr:BZ3500_MvSof-1268-A1-R1_Chr12-2g03813 [Microbotryum saponariae]